MEKYQGLADNHFEKHEDQVFFYPGLFGGPGRIIESDEQEERIRKLTEKFNSTFTFSLLIASVGGSFLGAIMPISFPEYFQNEWLQDLSFSIGITFAYCIDMILLVPRWRRELKEHGVHELMIAPKRSPYLQRLRNTPPWYSIKTMVILSVLLFYAAVGGIVMAVINFAANNWKHVISGTLLASLSGYFFFMYAVVLANAKQQKK